jgi:ABC-type Na+ transport system ATPase subunit NatA
MSWPDLFPKTIDRAITVIDYVRETKEPNAVYNSIRVFAELTAAQLASVTQDLKEILGDKLNLNDFRKAVNESEGYKTRNENNRPIIQSNNRPLDQM